MVVKKVPNKAHKSSATRVSSSANAASSDIETSDGHFREIILTASRIETTNHSKAERGEFRGDFTRDTFNSHNNFSQVLMQQGRVQIDADWNEQSSIALHYLRNLACDAGSEHWGPRSNAGFRIPERDEEDNNFSLRPGHYYVNGILCEIGVDENDDYITYETQPNFPLPENQTVAALTTIFENSNADLQALVYLDVWERHINYVLDDSIREVALGGPDTATRAQVIWQVKVLPIPARNVDWNNEGNHPLKESYRDFLAEISEISSPGLGTLCAKVKDKSDATDPCLIAPESRYSGTENQLYRVEIHKSGLAQGYATFKWSRENSSVVFPITNIQATLINLEHLGKDCRYGLKVNDWVEIVDDDSVLQNRANNLLQVEFIDNENRTVTLKDAAEKITQFEPAKHPYLRRWDHTKGDERGLKLVETSNGQGWLELEDGILVKFTSYGDTGEDQNGTELRVSNIYKTGDYWLIPARTITGNIEWPSDNEGNPKYMPANGIIHHYAPLALFNGRRGNDANGETTEIDVDLRRIIRQVWEDS